MPNQHTELLRSCRHVSGNSSVLSASQVTLNLTVILVVSRASLPPGAAGFSISWYEPLCPGEPLPSLGKAKAQLCCLKVVPVSEEREQRQCGVTGSLTCLRGPTTLSASHSPGFLTGKYHGQHLTHLKHTDSHFPNKLQIYGIRSTYPSEWSPQQAQQPLSIPFLSMHLLIFPMHLIINC